MARRRSLKPLIAYAVLGGAACASFLLPDSLCVPNTVAGSGPATIHLSGVIHDFLASHPDFDVVPAAGYGHYAGNLKTPLDAGGLPEFIGLGSLAFSEIAPPPPGFSGPWGYDTAFPSTTANMEKRQIATRVALPGPVIVKSISAYVGKKDRSVRYAIYSDSAGAPGTLVTETAVAKSNKTTMEWLTLSVPNVQLDAGVYWLALALEDKNQHHAYAPAGATTRVRLNDAVKDGFLTTWGASDAASTDRISIFATTEDASNLNKFGQTTILPTQVTKVEKKQIATRVSLPEDGTLLSISAYVGNKDKKVRYAVYRDQAGEPGALLAESFPDISAKTMGWLTLYLPDTPLTAGSYWLALAFEDKDHAMRVAAAGGMARYKANDAAKNGFLSAWGSSDSATGEAISIFATYRTTTEPVAYNGFKVTAQWLDAQSRPIAPHLTDATSDAAIDFVITDQMVIPDNEFVVEVRVLGAAIQTGSLGYHIPVTMQIAAGGTVFEPFGPYDDAVAGNVNDDQEITCNSNGTNPRCAVLSGTFPGGTPVAVDGRSWWLEGANGCVASHWDVNREASTTDNGVQIKVLRNGDPVPAIKGVYEQASAGQYIAGYVDVDTGLMTLGDSQVIYLFELGTSGSSSSADFQDLVVLVTLASDPAGLCGGGGGVMTTLCTNPFSDTAGTAIAAGVIDASGGITSAETFGEWFRPVMEKNMGLLHSITLVDDGTGVYTYIDDEFHPIDGRGLENEGQPHNHFFTYHIAADFTYQVCGNQFIEFDGADDAWIFVNGQLVMDRGGVLPGVSQIIEMDRLGLEDKGLYQVHFYYAQRQAVTAAFHLRTNIPLKTAGQVAVSDQFD
jgi:fibro-slime domain-containing protein